MADQSLSSNDRGSAMQDLSHTENARAATKPVAVMEHDDDPSKANIELEGATWTPEEEAHALKKLDWNLIPLSVHPTLGTFESLTCSFSNDPAADTKCT